MRTGSAVSHRCRYGFSTGLPRWLSGKESTCQCRRRRFNPWVRKIAWRRKWLPTAVFVPGKSHEQRSLADYSPWGHKRVGHGWVSEQQQAASKSASCMNESVTEWPGSHSLEVSPHPSQVHLFSSAQIHLSPHSHWAPSLHRACLGLGTKHERMSQCLSRIIWWVNEWMPENNPPGPRALDCKTIYHSDFLDCLPSVTVFKAPLTWSTNCLLPCNAQRKCAEKPRQLKCFDLWKEGILHQPLRCRVDSNKQKRKVTLSKWLVVGNEVIRFHWDCLLPPWTPGSRRQVCKECDHLAETPVLREVGTDPFPKMSIRGTVHGQKKGPSCCLHPRVHLLFLESQGKWHRQECVLGFKYILVILLNKCWGGEWKLT